MSVIVVASLRHVNSKCLYCICSRNAASSSILSFCFFFQAEDGIRDYKVTGVQTCALPILALELLGGRQQRPDAPVPDADMAAAARMARVDHDPGGHHAIGLLHRLALVQRKAHGRRGVQLRRSEEHTSELQSPCNLVCRLLLEKKKNN